MYCDGQVFFLSDVKFELDISADTIMAKVGIFSAEFSVCVSKSNYTQAGNLWFLFSLALAHQKVKLHFFFLQSSER